MWLNETENSVDLPHHKVRDRGKQWIPREGGTKVAQNLNIIHQMVRRGDIGKPALLITFRECNPSTPWGRRSHRSSGSSENKEGVAEWGRVRGKFWLVNLVLSRKAKRGWAFMACESIRRDDGWLSAGQ